jgi:DNA helicase-2/ATP-dependent DNA helicase PcrA
VDLLDGLDPAQHAAVTSTASPLCVLAGAGSGKTRVLTRRIAWRISTGDAQAAHVLALTFTRKAAGELAERLRVLGIRDQVAAGTFHAVAYAQLRRRWADQGRPAPALLDRKVRLLAQLLPRGRQGPPGDRPGGAAGAVVQPADLAGEIEWAKARMVSPEDYAAEAEGAGRRPPVPPSAMAALYRRYEDEKRRRGLVDFDDLLALCATAIETDPAFAAAQRWRFRHLFVDEFQDVNPAQFRLLSAWLGDSSDLCVVGDPRQAIYSWNGADPTLLTRFPDRFPAAEVVTLGENYRSSPQVLVAAASVLGGAGLHPNRPDGPVPEIRGFASDESEAHGVARLLRQARRPGAPWTDLAVLARTNAQLPILERALRAAQVPYRVAGGGGFLHQPEVRAALQALASAPPGQDFRSSLAELADSVSAATGDTEPEREADGPADGSAVEERRLQLANLVEMGREYAAMDQAPSAAGFRAWLAASLADGGDDRRADAVTLATFHRAKGLEWPVVVLVGLERGLVPIGRAVGPAAEAEERRLLYVAITRAAQRLVCTWAERRSFGGKALPRAPSPFLESLERACEEMLGRGAGQPSRPASGLRAARARLDRVPRRPAQEIEADADPVVMAALRKWRAAVARASGVPAYVIFHDSTLAAVAAARPRTAEQLLGLPGVGPVKVSRYGPELLALLAEHPAV